MENHNLDPTQQPSSSILHPISLIFSQDHNTLTLENKTPHDLNHFISDCKERKFDWSEFNELLQNIDSEDQCKRYSGLLGLRKLLSISSSIFYFSNIFTVLDGAWDRDELKKGIDAGLVSKPLELLRKGDDELQIQVCICKIIEKD